MIAAVQDDLVRRHRLTVQEYYRMVEVGLLAPDARTELIEGEIIDMAMPGPPHSEIVTRLHERLLLALHGIAIVRNQQALRLDEYSEPGPDIVLVKRKSTGYARAHPTPPDVLLVVEVSDTSLRFDRERKLPLYARCGIPEYWIVDVVKPALHIFHTPQSEQYLCSSSMPRPGIIALTSLLESTLDLTGLFEGL
jgi:Uma2 family endonuclease